METKKDYFENEKNIVTVCGDRCGSVNIPMFKALTIDSYKGRSYVVVTRKGMQDFLLVNVLYAYYDGKKNVHYKEFITKKAANNFLEKYIKEAKDNFLKRTVNNINN
jgi:hypothetical protein